MRRSTPDLYAAILAVGEYKPGYTQTRLQERANVPIKRIKGCVGNLVEFGLLEKIPDTRPVRYRTTERGEKFLENFRYVKSTIDSLNIDSV
jgi:predicted transcriptional regulator